MTKIYLIILCAVSILAIACGAGESKLQIKIGGKDSTLEVKSSGTYTKLRK